MRNRILAGLGVAALATVGVAAPANAISDTTADLYVVHAVPDVTVDVYVNDALTLEAFEPTTVAGPLDLPAGDYEVAIFATGADPAVDAPAIGPATFALEANTSYTVVAHPDETGALTATAFVNDISAIAAGEARVTVRHTAEAPAVDVLAGGDVVIPGLENGNEAGLDVPAGELLVSVTLAGGGAEVLPETTLNLAEGTSTIVHAYNATDAGIEVIVQTISGLGEAPAGIPGGQAGLVSESSSVGWAAAGVALLLAVLAGVGVIARRQTVSAER